MWGSLLSKSKHFNDNSKKEFSDSLGYLDWLSHVARKTFFSSSYSESSYPIRSTVDAEFAIHAANWVKEKISWLNFSKTEKMTFDKDKDLENLRKSLEIREKTYEEEEEHIAEEQLGKANSDLAEAYVALLSFKQALPYCLKELEIHEKQLGQDSMEVAHDRKLLGIVYCGLEKHDEALDQYVLAQRILKKWNLNSDLLRETEIDAANMVIAQGRHDEAVGNLINVLLLIDKDSQTRALALVSIAKALCNQGKFAGWERCLEISHRILDKRESISPVELSMAYYEISKQYETMNQFETAISLLKRALALLERHPQEQHSQGMVSGRIGSLLLLTGKVQSSLFYLESAAARLPLGVDYVYNNFGVAYMELDRPQLALDMFDYAECMEGIERLKQRRTVQWLKLG